MGERKPTDKSFVHRVSNCAARVIWQVFAQPAWFLVATLCLAIVTLNPFTAWRNSARGSVAELTIVGCLCGYLAFGAVLCLLSTVLRPSVAGGSRREWWSVSRLRWWMVFFACYLLVIDLDAEIVVWHHFHSARWALEFMAICILVWLVVGTIMFFASGHRIFVSLLEAQKSRERKGKGNKR